jgi:hypothetical protein
MPRHPPCNLVQMFVAIVFAIILPDRRSKSQHLYSSEMTSLSEVNILTFIQYNPPPHVYHVCQICGKRHTPSSLPILFMSSSDRLTARIISCLALYLVPRNFLRNRFCPALRRKGRHLQARNPVMSHDYAMVHTADVDKTLRRWRWGRLQHPPSSPDTFVR